jgi:ribose transport system substrate-binding protein
MSSPTNSLFRGLIVSIAFLLVIIGSSGCTDSGGGGSADSGGGKKRLILLTNGFSPFWEAGRVGVEGFEKEKLGGTNLTASLEPNDGTVVGQINKLRQYAAQGDVAGVAISITDAANAALADEMRKLQAKGVFVLTVDADLDREKFRDARFAYLGTDNRVGGEMLGRCAKHLRPDGGAYVTFVGRNGSQNAIERIAGVAVGAGEKFKNLDSMIDEEDRSRARENVRNAIRNHPGLNCLAGIWSYNAPAIADVVKELDKREEMAVVCFDAEPLAIKQMADGMIDALVVQNPYQMAYQSMRLLKALIDDDRSTVAEMLPNHGKAEGDIFDTGIKVIAPNSGTPLKAAQFGDQVEFLTIGAFQSWLKKNKLTGS